MLQSSQVCALLWRLTGTKQRSQLGGQTLPVRLLFVCCRGSLVKAELILCQEVEHYTHLVFVWDIFVYRSEII